MKLETGTLRALLMLLPLSNRFRWFARVHRRFYNLWDGRGLKTVGHKHAAGGARILEDAWWKNLRPQVI